MLYLSLHMSFKKYMLAFGDPEQDQLKTTYISKFRLIMVVSSIALLWLGFSYGITRLILRGEIAYQTIELRRENTILKDKFKNWEDRLDQMNMNVASLKERNQKIRVTASLSLPEPEYGVGGKQMGFRSDMLSIPELDYLENRINRIDEEISMIHMSTAQLENVLSSKLNEIAHYPSIRPVRGGWISSPFGKRLDPFTGVEEMHPALDISIKPGSDVLCTGAGTVKAINNTVVKLKGYGKYIIVDHGYGYETMYAHLSEIFVKPGQKVKRWDLIGLTGNTGKSTAPHIHYGVMFNKKALNPMDFLLE